MPFYRVQLFFPDQEPIDAFEHEVDEKIVGYIDANTHELIDEKGAAMAYVSRAAINELPSQ